MWKVIYYCFFTFFIVSANDLPNILLYLWGQGDRDVIFFAGSMLAVGFAFVKKSTINGRFFLAWTVFCHFMFLSFFEFFFSLSYQISVDNKMSYSILLAFSVNTRYISMFEYMLHKMSFLYLYFEIHQFFYGCYDVLDVFGR